MNKRNTVKPAFARPGAVSAADRKQFYADGGGSGGASPGCRQGGPFGAIVVHGTRIAGSSGNCVFKHTDPTAHAEIMAIRDACENLNKDDLTGCDIYSSGEPCPMCMAAVYWARMGAVFFCTEKDALAAGFVDKLILEELRKVPEDRKIKSRRIRNARGLNVFRKARKMGVGKAGRK